MTLFQSPFADLGIFQLSGLVGVFICLFSFTAVQFDWIDGNSAVFSVANIAAVSLVAISPVADFNLSSALIQGSWIAIGLTGLALRLRRRAHTKVSQGSFGTHP